MFSVVEEITFVCLMCKRTLVAPIDIFKLVCTHERTPVDAVMETGNVRLSESR